MANERTTTAGVRCPACKHQFRRPADAGPGDKIRCPKCNQKIRLGGGEKKDPRIGQVVGGYRLTKRLGGGAMGVVYEGAKDGSDKHVAVKLLSKHAMRDRELYQRFKREAKLTIDLRHPHLVASYDSGKIDDTAYLVMELVRGVPLSKVVDRSGAMDWRKATELVLQVAEALAYLDTEGVIHRDIKPENIMVDGDRIAKLADLGFAKQRGVVEEQAGEVQLTMAGTALGSPAYMAPEQVMDAASATHVTDLYCLGASYYHLVTGQMPFDGKSAMVVMSTNSHAVMTRACV